MDHGTESYCNPSPMEHCPGTVVAPHYFRNCGENGGFYHHKDSPCWDQGVNDDGSSVDQANYFNIWHGVCPEEIDCDSHGDTSEPEMTWPECATNDYPIPCGMCAQELDDLYCLDDCSSEEKFVIVNQCAALGVDMERFEGMY